MPDSWLEAEGEMAAKGAQLTAPAAFTHLYQRYLTPIYSYIRSRVNDRADAEDLTEQVFIEALEGRGRYEEELNEIGEGPWEFSWSLRANEVTSLIRPTGNRSP